MASTQDDLTVDVVSTGSIGQSPAPTDVVVVPCPSKGNCFAIRRGTGVPQLSWASRDAAVSAAREYARRQMVDVWWMDNRETQVLHRYRPHPKHR